MTDHSLLTDELCFSDEKAEQWKSIPGYEGVYEASTHGRIRSAEGKTTASSRFPHRSWAQRVLKPKQKTGANGRKDLQVTLWKDGRGATFLVSRLVAMTWCGGFSDELTVNHINGDSLDNRSANLEWCSRSENIRKGFQTGLYRSICKKVNLTDLSDGTTLSFDSMSQASSFLGRNSGYVSLCVKRDRDANACNGRTYKILFEQFY